MTLKNKKYFTLFITPAVLAVVVFLIYPLFRTFYYSLTDWKNFSPKQNFAGLKNYIRLINDPVILTALRNTFIMMVGVFIFQVGVSLLLALLVSNTGKLFKFLRTTYFLPILISATAIGLMFKLIYGYEYGLLNLVIGFFGLDKQVWINEKTSIFSGQYPHHVAVCGLLFRHFPDGHVQNQPRHLRVGGTGRHQTLAESHLHYHTHDSGCAYLGGGAGYFRLLQGV